MGASVQSLVRGEQQHSGTTVPHSRTYGLNWDNQAPEAEGEIHVRRKNIAAWSFWLFRQIWHDQATILQFVNDDNLVICARSGPRPMA
jgi:hypothetical protein